VRFLAASVEAGMQGLQGHHRMGGLQASPYNAAPVESVQALTAFMVTWQQR
jgi:phosphoserine aminotransferase